MKANCYDLSGNTRENWQERTVWIAVWDGILNNSNIWVNEKITKAEAYEYMLKAGKVKTPKSSNTEAMKYLGVIGEDENDESTTLPRAKARRNSSFFLELTLNNMKKNKKEIDKKLVESVKTAIIKAFFEIFIYLIWIYLLFKISILVFGNIFEQLKFISHLF